jgi:hypothetical protein
MSTECTCPIERWSARHGDHAPECPSFTPAPLPVSDSPVLDLKDWLVIKARDWDTHDQFAIVRPFVDRLVSEVERLRALHASTEKRNCELREALEARHRDKPIDDPDYCQGCGGRYRFDTSIDSQLWNAIIRANNLPEYLCAACIVREFVKRGEGFAATLWGDEFNGTQITVTIGNVHASTEGAQRDELLRRDNAEIEHQQTLQRVQRAGELLEALTFWPSPNADQNLARDVGRVLQGKSAERSTGVEETLNEAGAFAMSWKQKAEATEGALRQVVERLENYYDFQCEAGPLKNCVEWHQLKAILATSADAMLRQREAK